MKIAFVAACEPKTGSGSSAPWCVRKHVGDNGSVCSHDFTDALVLVPDPKIVKDLVVDTVCRVHVQALRGQVFEVVGLQQKKSGQRRRTNRSRGPRAEEAGGDFAHRNML